MEKEVIKVTAENYKEVLNSEIPTIIKVGAEWCGPCRAMKPVLEDIRKSYGSNVLNVGEVDIDEFPDIADEFGIRNVPTTLFFNKEGKLETRLVGAIQRKEIDECISLICGEQESRNA